jgi:ABC-2 type transport system permease protein
MKVSRSYLYWLLGIPALSGEVKQFFCDMSRHKRTFVSTLTNPRDSAVSIMMGMIMALMGGCWYPLELFPSVVQNIVKILPTTWAMQGLLTLVLRGGGLIDILPEAGVLLGFATVFFSIGVMRFRYE